MEGKPLGKKINDTQSCASQWLQQKKGVSKVDSRTTSKKFSDFHIETDNEMEQFLWGVVDCIKRKSYKYTAKPPQDSPEWNGYITKLRSGSLGNFVSDFVDHIT
jgi:hypothetical protein